VPFARPGGTLWRMMEEFDTGDPVNDALPGNFIERIVDAYIATGKGRQGEVGEARALLVDAADILPFGIDWLEAAV
jgi:aminoglycoside 3-N-acetyltransferase